MMMPNFGMPAVLPYYSFVLQPHHGVAQHHIIGGQHPTSPESCYNYSSWPGSCRRFDHSAEDSSSNNQVIGGADDDNVDEKLENRTIAASNDDDDERGFLLQLPDLNLDP